MLEAWFPAGPTAPQTIPRELLPTILRPALPQRPAVASATVPVPDFQEKVRGAAQESCIPSRSLVGMWGPWSWGWQWPQVPSDVTRGGMIPRHKLTLEAWCTHTRGTPCSELTPHALCSHKDAEAGGEDLLPAGIQGLGGQN